MAIKRLRLIIAVLAIGVAAAHVARAGPRDLLAEGVSGGDERLWTASVLFNTDKNLPGQRTIFRVRGPGESARWRQVAEIAAPARSLTHRGGELVVLLENGDWRFVADSGVRSGDRLPGGNPVLAIAGEGDTLWAVGTAVDGAATTTSPSTTRTSATVPTTQVEIESRPAATTSAAATTAPGARMLYRLDRGEWSAIAQLPSQLLPRTGPLAMTVIDGRPLIAAMTPDGEIRTVQLTDGHAWFDRGTIRPASPIARFDLLRFRGRPALWAAGNVGTGVVYHFENGWKDPSELVTEPALDPGTDRALTVAFGRLRLLYAGGDGTLFEQNFNPDGTADTPPTKGTVQAQPPDPQVTRLVQLGVMVLLMFVMLSTLRRRGSMQEAMRRADKLALAPLLTRFLAGMIDALPLIAVPAFVLLTSPTLAAARERMDEPMIQAWQGGAALVYLTYTALAEMLFARTVGKWIFGMRVANLDGTRPTGRAILIRNVMRLVDITLALFPLIMVFLSPLRQRIGDVAAGTLVVRSGVVVPPPAAGAPAAPDDE
ncbi:MAG: RDD family protein [Planctomycetota bacterium]|nr:RDD family protein [Planctomycetota bacterium]